MKTLKHIFAKAGIYCMAITVIYALILLAVNQSEHAAITLKQYMSVVLFSLLLSVSGLLFKLEILPKVAIQSLHYLACTVSFLVVFAAFGNIQINNPSQILFLFLGFSLLYLVLEGAKALATFLLSRYLKSEDKTKSEKADSEYKPLYK